MKSLYLLLFLTGSFPLVLSVSCKYYLIQQGRNWKDAQAYCQATYTDLAIVEDNDDMIKLQSETQKQQLNSSAWIGLYNDINSWRWSFGNEPLGSMRKWAYGEPNNSGGHQECVAIQPWGWTDKQCTSKFPFVCIDDSSNTERYINIPVNMTWFEAQSYCRTHHTDLASTTNAEEYSIMRGFFPDQTWIGLFRDSWKWIDKTNFSTVKWMDDKPDNKLWNENCGYLNKSQAGDAKCSDIKPFFCCARITGQKQIVRVKIQTNQDVKDTDVKAAILDQIKQKLKDHGMAENITVKWREQPDGTVFHKENRNKVRAGKCDI